MSGFWGTAMPIGATMILCGVIWLAVGMAYSEIDGLRQRIEQLEKRK